MVCIDSSRNHLGNRHSTLQLLLQRWARPSGNWFPVSPPAHEDAVDGLSGCLVVWLCAGSARHWPLRATQLLRARQATVYWQLILGV